MLYHILILMLTALQMTVIPSRLGDAPFNVVECLYGHYRQEKDYPLFKRCRWHPRNEYNNDNGNNVLLVSRSIKARVSRAFVQHYWKKELQK